MNMSCLQRPIHLSKMWHPSPTLWILEDLSDHWWLLSWRSPLLLLVSAECWECSLSRWGLECVRGFIHRSESAQHRPSFLKHNAHCWDCSGSDLPHHGSGKPALKLHWGSLSLVIQVRLVEMGQTWVVDLKLLSFCFLGTPFPTLNTQSPSSGN